MVLTGLVSRIIEIYEGMTSVYNGINYVAEDKHYSIFLVIPMENLGICSCVVISPPDETGVE